VNTVQEYQVTAETLPDDVWLGQLVAYSISEADVEIESMRSELFARNLRAGILKDRIRPVDAFKRAAKELEKKFKRGSGSARSIMIRSVGEDPDASYRHVVLETAKFGAGNKRQLYYDTLAELTYNRGDRKRGGVIVNDSISINVTQDGVTLLPEEVAWLNEHLGDDGEKLRERFEHWKTHMDTNSIRTYVRTYLDALGAVAVKKHGGLYFVPQKHAKELEDLASFIKSIGSEMHAVPLVNIVNQKTMVLEALQDDVTARVSNLTVKMNEILSSPSRQISGKTYDALIDEGSNILTMVNEYEGILEENLETTKLAVKFATGQLMNLGSRIRVKKGESGD
jgi:hypothetical protein